MEVGGLSFIVLLCLHPSTFYLRVKFYASGFDPNANILTTNPQNLRLTRKEVRSPKATVYIIIIRSHGHLYQTLGQSI